jgi:hypothetical protein
MTDNEVIFDIRGRLLAGVIGYDQARIEATPVIESMNKQGRAIARKHGKRFGGFSFSALMR